MARHIREEDLQAIEEVVRPYPEGRTARQIGDAPGLGAGPPDLAVPPEVPGRRRSPDHGGQGPLGELPHPLKRTLGVSSDCGRFQLSHSQYSQREVIPPLSEAAAEILEHVRQPLEARQPVGYDRAFLDSYRPGETFYLSEAEREHLREVGTPKIPGQPAGTYARPILNRLLIDLSWNSSRLEGNTYSLLDTTRLLEIGEETEGKERLEALMILNHKDAIEFLVDGAEDIGFNRYTPSSNLHALLADNLLADPEATGRLRHIGVGIAGSVFHPLEMPPLIQECFDQVLEAASAIRDPFEQAFFVMVQLPYLQPFDDVNKRVSRLAANIPLFKGNLSPLSFEDVPRDLYTEAILGVYELKRIELLRDVFLWGYGRSAARYAAARQSLAKPDPFRMRHRTELREIVGDVVRGGMDKKQAAAHISSWTQENIDARDGERFREIAERELLSLHKRNCARYRVTPSDFEAWQEVWSS